MGMKKQAPAEDIEVEEEERMLSLFSTKRITAQGF